MEDALPRDHHRLLIAMPQLQDPNFSRTVSLLASFDGNGAFGIVLNRPMPLSVDQLLTDQMTFPADKTLPLYFGGPVQENSLWFLHSYPDLHNDGIQILENLFLCTNLKTVEAVVTQHAHDPNPLFRFFLGYAGWSPGQLESEIAQSSWVTGSVDINELYSCDPEQFWTHALARLGVNDPSVLVSPANSGAAH